MGLFSRLASNMGFNNIKGLAGAAKGFVGAAADIGGLRQAGRLFMKGGDFIGRGMMGRGKGYVRMAGREAGGWLTGAGFSGGRRAGVAAARIGGAAIGGMAAADFLNPWGLGWGD